MEQRLCLREHIDADAPNVVWAIDFQFDSTADGIKFKIASMVDEHTRESLLDITARSITGAHLVAALEAVIAVRGTPVLIRCDGFNIGVPPTTSFVEEKL